MTRTVDAVVIGSGHNGLVAAAYLARAGWSVEVLERAERAGGAVTTEELTLPGFRHDTFSSWHPLFMGSAAYAELGPELEGRGLRYVNTDVPTGVAYGDGQALVAARDPRRTVEGFDAADGAAFLAELGRFGAIADVIGELLSSELHAPRTAGRLVRLGRRLGARGSLAAAAFSVQARAAGSSRPSPVPSPACCTRRGCCTPASSRPRPAAPCSSSPSRAACTPAACRSSRAAPSASSPPSSGSSPTTAASCAPASTSRNPGRRRPRDERRRGRRARRGAARGGRERDAAPALRAAAGRPLAAAGGDTPPRPPPARRAASASAAARCRSTSRSPSRCAGATAGSTPPRSSTSPTARGGRPRLRAGGRRPAARPGRRSSAASPAPSIRRARPTARPSCGSSCRRSPTRRSPTPRASSTPPRGGRRSSPAPTPTASSPGSPSTRRTCRAPCSGGRSSRRSTSSGATSTCRRGDPYAGAAHLDQALPWRPLPGYGSHRTPVDGLWQIGASTHPGPGLNAASGRMVAQRLIAGDGGPGAALRRIRGRVGR